jgi:aminopeptidase N
LFTLAPEDWKVISTCQQEKTISAEAITPAVIADFKLDDAMLDEMKKAFGETKFYGAQFAKSVAISTYIYSMVAGPFYEISSKVEYKVPLKLFCRHSLAKYMNDIAEDWFRVTRHGIDYYGEMFACEYPFDKLDQVFAPDYNMGAMENVGCILYRDQYLEREDKFPRVRKENIYNTILHEISHMWFGNLVTMKWWNDLWLNESFANMISWMCMEEAKGLEDITLAWYNFMSQNFSGLTQD